MKLLGVVIETDGGLDAFWQFSSGKKKNEPRLEGGSLKGVQEEAR